MVTDEEIRLKTIMRRRGSIPNHVMKGLEEKYGIKLTEEYGSYDPRVVKRIIKKLKLYNGR